MSTDTKKYAKIARKMEKRFGKKRNRRRNNTFQTLGTLRNFEKLDDGVQVMGENGSLSLRFLAPNLIQVRVRPDHQFPTPFSYSIDSNFTPEISSLTVSEDTDVVLVGAGAMACLISRHNCQLRIVLPSGQEVSLDADTGLAWNNDETVRWRRHLPPEERCHGLGQRAWGLDLRGKSWQLWNYDPVTYHRDSDPCYFSIPFYLGVHKDYSLGVLWDNPARGRVDLGAAQTDRMEFSSEAGELRFYLIADENPKKVTKRYFELTGMMPLPPLWAFGYHQSRWSYTPSNRFRELAAEFRRRQIPCDVLHFDIDYLDGFRVFTWDPHTFGDLSSLISELNSQGFKTISIVDPGIKADPNYGVFKSGQAVDAFLKYPDGSLFLAPVWAGESAFPDFTNPAVRSWWAEHVAKLMAVGFDALWNDMNEPTVFLPKGAGTIPEYIPADMEGHKGTHLQGAHNVYGMQMARATTEGLLRARPDERVFSLTRAAYAGAQRYTGSWTGDNVSTWDHLRLSISMVLNLGLSGITFTGPDIGGWADSPDPELYARWIQVGSMLPFCRTHTAKDTKDQEPWSFGTEVEAIARRYISLRYQLLPYIYSSFAQCAAHGTPLVYPTFMYDPTDEKLANQDDAFMLGESLLIAPVLEKGATSREIYLPRGVWYDFHTNKLIDGARSIQVDAPLDHMPMYAKAGKLIPMWETMQYVGEKTVEELQLRAFAGPGETAIYEDSGTGLGYTQGQYRWSYFTLSFMPNGQFAIDWRTAGSYEPPYKKARLEVIGIPGEPGQVLVDGQPAPLWFFEGGHVEILSNPFSSVRLVGKARSDSAAAETIARKKPSPPTTE